MANELLSRVPIKKNETIIKPVSLEPKDNKIKPKPETIKSKNESTNDIKTQVESGINKIKEENKEKLDQLYNSSELIFTKIVEDLHNQVKSKPEATKKMDIYLVNNGKNNSTYLPDAKVGIMNNELFNNNELIQELKTHPTPNNIAQLSTLTKDGIKFLHNLSQKIVLIQNLVKIAKENKVIVDQTNINKFFDYYDSLEKVVTASQKELAFAQEPYNGYTLGYHELIANPIKYITSNFRVNPYYNTGDIVSSTEDGADVKAIGIEAEKKVNSTISTIEGMVMVVAGPNFSILDTVSKVDSISFYASQKIEEPIRRRLVELSYKISYSAYQESLIKDYQESDPKKVRKHEVVPKSYIDKINNLNLSEQGINVYKNDLLELDQKIEVLQLTIKQNEDKISELKSKAAKSDTASQKNITKIKKQNDASKKDLDKLIIESQSLQLIIENKQNSINILKTEAQSIYENYNPQGLAIPLILSPEGQIEVYQDGLKIQYKNEEYSDYAKVDDIKNLENEFNELLIKNNIRTNAIQIKQNVNTTRVKEAINNGKYTGAIGTSMDYNAEPTTLKDAIAMSLNIDDTIDTLSTPLKSTSKTRSR